MNRAEDCLDAAHLHVGVCQRAGYANGRADVIEELESAICEACGAVVADGWQARHAGWHEGMGDDEVANVDGGDGRVWRMPKSMSVLLLSGLSGDPQNLADCPPRSAAVAQHVDLVSDTAGSHCEHPSEVVQAVEGDVVGGHVAKSHEDSFGLCAECGLRVHSGLCHASRLVDEGDDRQEMLNRHSAARLTHLEQYDLSTSALAFRLGIVDFNDVIETVERIMNERA